MNAENKNFAPPRQTSMKLQPPGTRRRANDVPAQDDDESVKIGAVQERICEIKNVLKEKTPMMSIWGTLSDLYALKATLQTQASHVAVLQGEASQDAIDKSMAEYVAGYKDYQTGDLENAEGHFVASIDWLGWNVLARLTLGNLFFVENEHEKAEASFLAAVPHCEADALSEVLTNLGMNALKAGNVSGAEIYFKKAIDVDPANAYALNNLGLVSESREDLNSAISWHIKAVEANALDEELWYNLGNVLGKAGQKAERLFCFMRAEERGFTELKELVDDLVSQGIKPVDPRSSPACQHDS